MDAAVGRGSGGGHCRPTPSVASRGFRTRGRQEGMAHIRISPQSLSFLVLGRDPVFFGKQLDTRCGYLNHI